MGCVFQVRTLLGTIDEIKDKWSDAVYTSRTEDGNSYSGNIGMLSTLIPDKRFLDKRFATPQDAADYIDQNTEKWHTDPLAVTFWHQPTKPDPQLQKQREHDLIQADHDLNLTSKAIRAAEQQWQNQHTPSNTITCQHCSTSIPFSRLSHPTCPVCNNSLLPADIVSA